MNDGLDDAMVTLARASVDHPLGRLEADVWAEVRRRPIDEGGSSWLRWSAVGAALGLGVLAGGVSAAAERRPPEMAAFDVQASLAPSSLLGAAL